MSQTNSGATSPQPEGQIRVWTVVIDGQPDSTATYPDLDDALAYVRGYISTNGSRDVQLTSELVSSSEYISVAEKQDSPPDGWMDEQAWTGAEN